jgi:predicted RNA methylase
MSDKRDFLFRFVPQHIRQRLQIDDEALYSTTDQITSRRICDEIRKFVPVDACVVDTTACIGGLTYALTSVFKQVIAIEINDVRYQYLQQNMQLLNISDKVVCLHGDAIDICVSMDAQVIVIDPPWGGPDYKKESQLRLRLSGVDIGEVCTMMFSRNPLVQYIAVKAPININDDTFVMHKVVQKAKLRKMILIILERS